MITPQEAVARLQMVCHHHLACEASLARQYTETAVRADVRWHWLERLLTKG